MSFILDNSVAMTWCFEDEATALTDGLLDRVFESGAFTTSFWPLEASNVLMMAERRGRISAEKRIHKLRFLHELPIVPDFETYAMAWTAASELAVRYQLTSHNAAYLELAIRYELPLATLDKDLQRAAKKLKIEVWGA